MATDSIFRSLSHSAICTHSGVVAPKSATSRPLPSKPDAHTQCRSLPISIPANLGAYYGQLFNGSRTAGTIPTLPVIPHPRHLSEHNCPAWRYADSALGECY